MNIYLSENLKKLRREKGNTQDDLAMHLGITAQAISKWERDEGFPDITLLPMIASYYNVSVDDLLGVGKIEKEKKLNEFHAKDAELSRAGKNAERVALCREVKREFPNDLWVINNLMYALQAENRKEHADEIIECGERILAEATDASLRAGAIQSLSFTYYYAKDDAETAKKYARMADSVVTCDEIMPHILKGEEAVAYCQKNLQQHFDMIRVNAEIMCNKGNYSTKDKIKVYTFILDCFRLLYSDGNYGFYHSRMARCYTELAHCYLDLGDESQMFFCLEKATEHAIKFDTRKDGMNTSFMVNKVMESVEDAYKDYSENDCGLLLKALRKNSFAHLQEDPRMINLIKKLEPIAVL